MGLRIIGDVHAQVDFVLRREAHGYLELIADCDYSVQLGDMGDAETYAELNRVADVERHRFFGGNHDHYSHLPPHALGDYGPVNLGGVEFFFIRGASDELGEWDGQGEDYAASTEVHEDESDFSAAVEQEFNEMIDSVSASSQGMEDNA